MKKIYWIGSIALLILVILFTLAYQDYSKYNVSNQYNDAFKSSLYETIENKNTFTFNEVVSFEWDEMFVFEPYLTTEMMEKAAGAEWTTANTWLGHIYQRTKSNHTPLLSDSFQKLVFLKEKKVVMDITLQRDVDFLSLSKLSKEDNTVLKVDEADNRLVVNLAER